MHEGLMTDRLLIWVTRKEALQYYIGMGRGPREISSSAVLIFNLPLEL
jgi:hypothetical protein